MGIIPAQFFDVGSIGVVSKSGTLTYQIGNELKQAGMGNSTIVGIGGDPIVGSDFIDILTLFEADDETELIVMVGEIGGDAEERAAEFISAERLEAGGLVVGLEQGEDVDEVGGRQAGADSDDRGAAHARLLELVADLVGQGARTWRSPDRADVEELGRDHPHVALPSKRKTGQLGPIRRTSAVQLRLPSQRGRSRARRCPR